MTRECDERMWNLAYRLARSGEHQNYQAVEWELRASGFPRARGLLDCERVREKLDRMCAEARAIREHLVTPDTTLALSTTALLSVGVAFPGVALAQQKSLKEQITGKWTVVSNDSVALGPTRCGSELQQSPADNDRAL
jgi:hypothetical protein